MSVQDYELLLRVRADLNQALGGLDNLKRKLGDGEQGAQRMAKGGAAATTAMRSLGAAISAIGVAKLVKDYFSAADAASNMAAKVSLVTDSTAAQVVAQKQLFAISQQTSSDLGTTTELYVKLAQSSDALRKNQTLLVGTTKLVNQALALSGADAGTASGVVRQFAQAMASGVLRGDEFNSIMEGAPRLAKAMADGLQVPVGALRAMAAQGQLTADKVIGALAEQGTVVDREFGSMPITIGRAMQQVRNSLQAMIGDADATSGASRDVAEAVQDLARTLESPEVKAGFAAMISGLVSVARYAAEGLSEVSKFMKLVGEEIARRQGNFAVDDIDGITAALDRATKARDEWQKQVDDWRPDWMKSGPRQELAAAEAEVSRLQNLLAVGQRMANSVPTGGAPGSDVVTMPTVTVHGPVVDPKTAKAAADAAVAAAKAAAAAQKEQINTLIGLQAALDPTVKAWAEYNAVVAKQDELAATQKAVAGANVDAIDARRNAIVQLAAMQRDANLKGLSDADRKAWEQVRDSLRTPMEVRMDNAIDKITQLKELLEKGTITRDQFRDSLSKVGQGAVAELPTYQGVDASVGGAAGELAKNLQARQDLETSYAQQAADLKKRFDDDDLASHQAYLAAKAQLDADYAGKSRVIEQSRQQLMLVASADFFGQLATLQHSSNNKIAKIGKAAAIAQAMINTYLSATTAMAQLPWPVNIAAAAVAVANGLANVAQIRSQQDSFDVGGYTGPGGVREPAGVVHRGEVVWSQRDVARAGGVGVVEAMRLGYRGYADGGFVHPLAGVPGPSMPASSNLQLPASLAGASGGSSQGGTSLTLHNHNYIDIDDLRERILTGAKAETHIVNQVLRNGKTIKQSIG